MKPKHLTIALFLTCIVCVCFASAAFAQTPVQVPNAPVQVPVNTAGSGSVIVRPLWTEITLTVMMFGLALFAVGRSSNRS